MWIDESFLFVGVRKKRKCRGVRVGWLIDKQPLVLIVFLVVLLACFSGWFNVLPDLSNIVRCSICIGSSHDWVINCLALFGINVQLDHNVGFLALRVFFLFVVVPLFTVKMITNEIIFIWTRNWVCSQNILVHLGRFRDKFGEVWAELAANIEIWCFSFPSTDFLHLRQGLVHCLEDLVFGLRLLSRILHSEQLLVQVILGLWIVRPQGFEVLPKVAMGFSSASLSAIEICANFSGSIIFFIRLELRRFLFAEFLALRVNL